MNMGETMVRLGRAYGQMPRTLNRLSTLKVTRAKKRGMYADGGGLYLRVAAGGSKNWVFRYTANGRLRDMGLGPVHTLSLAEARDAATECRKLRLRGVDPITHRRASLAAGKASDAKAMSFRECAEAYMAGHESGWHNARHREQWRNSLQSYVYPLLGGLPVNAIDTGLVMQVVQPMWKDKTETASRVRGRIELVLDWAKASGFRDGENPARWRGHLEQLLPKRSKVRQIKHLAALPYREAGAFMSKLRQQDSVPARALEFVVLTAARVGEVLDATWDEVDFHNRIWTVPAGRMKARREHRVPLSDAAMRVLQKMRHLRQDALIFPGNRDRRPMSQMTLLILVKTIAGMDINVHGLRSTFRDWAAERTNFPREVAEMALAHAIPNAVEAAYRRGDLFEKRSKLMEAWAEFCGKPQSARR
jgi:integrase